MKNTLIISIIVLALILGGLLTMLLVRRNMANTQGREGSPAAKTNGTAAPGQRRVVMPTRDPNWKPEGGIMPENEGLRKLQQERLAN